MRNVIAACVAAVFLSGCTSVTMTADYTGTAAKVSFVGSAPSWRSIDDLRKEGECRIAKWCKAIAATGDRSGLTPSEAMQATKAFAGFVNILFPAHTVKITVNCTKKPRPCKKSAD